MKKSLRLLVLLLCMVLVFASGCASREAAVDTAGNVKPGTATLDPSRTWAVLMEMNDFPGDDGDLPMDYINSNRMKDTLVKLGCSEDHIKLVQGELTIKAADSGVKWLSENSKKGDTIIVYVFAHGSWIGRQISWDDWFPKEWSKLADRSRILFVDSCGSGKYIENITGGAKPTISISSVSANEILWAGLEEEKLPIIGSVWNYYFTEAIFDRTADTNGDGYVSIEEAYRISNERAQKYTMEKVLTVPAFLEDYHELNAYPERADKYPNAVLKENMGGELLLYKLK